MAKCLLSAFVLFMFLALPPIVRAQRTSFDFDRRVNFSQYRTYGWKEGTPAGEHFFDRRVVASIDAQLAAKGLTKETLNPDLYVLYHVGLGVQRSVNGFVTAGAGIYGWGGGPGALDVRLNELAMGTLVIDIADASKQELVWRGVATQELDVDMKPEKRDAAIAKAIDKILKNYPPKARG